MENSLNTPKIKNKRTKKTLEEKKQLNDAYGPLGISKEVKQQIDKPINLIARRYELAYMKLYNELPKWKQQSFKNSPRNNDTLYNEFIASVIALAENENQEILLTA